MSRVLSRGRWAAPLVLLLGLTAGRPAPAAAAPIPAGLALTAAVTTAVEQVCYKEAAAYASATVKFLAALDNFNRLVDRGTGEDVQAAAETMQAAADAMVWAGILFVVCLIGMM